MSDHPTDFVGSIPDAITDGIKAKIPDAVVTVSGGGGHYTIDVVSPVFEGKSMLESQRLVLGSIKQFRERGKWEGRRQRDLKNARFGRGEIDGDIAAMKSLNWHTKQRLQREREVKRAARQAANWNYNEIMDILDVNPALRALIPDIPTEDEL